MRKLLSIALIVLAVGGFVWKRPPSRATLRERAQGSRRQVTRIQQRIRRRGGDAALSGKEAAEAFLRQAGVSYQLQHHPQVFTAQEIAEAEDVSGDRVAKVVMVQADELPVMLLLPASQRVDFNALPDILGARSVRLAKEEEFADLFPGSEIGAEPPFGHGNAVAVYVEQSLAEQSDTICAAGTHTDTVTLAYEDFARLVEPTVATFAQEDPIPAHLREVGRNQED